jgi:hypothetical protein
MQGNVIAGDICRCGPGCREIADDAHTGAHTESRLFWQLLGFELPRAVGTTWFGEAWVARLTRTGIRDGRHEQAVALHAAG